MGEVRAAGRSRRGEPVPRPRPGRSTPRSASLAAARPEQAAVAQLTARALRALLGLPPGTSSARLQTAAGAGSPGPAAAGAASGEWGSRTAPRGPGRKGRAGTGRGDAGAEGRRRGADPESSLSGGAERRPAGDTLLGPGALKEPARRAPASGPGRESARNRRRPRQRPRHHERRGRRQLQAGGDPAEVPSRLPAAWDPQTLE